MTTRVLACPAPGPSASMVARREPGGRRCPFPSIWSLTHVSFHGNTGPDSVDHGLRLPSITTLVAIGGGAGKRAGHGRTMAGTRGKAGRGDAVVRGRTSGESPRGA